MIEKAVVAKITSAHHTSRCNAAARSSMCEGEGRRRKRRRPSQLTMLYDEVEKSSQLDAALRRKIDEVNAVLRSFDTPTVDRYERAANGEWSAHVRFRDERLNAELRKIGVEVESTEDPNMRRVWIKPVAPVWRFQAWTSVMLNASLIMIVTAVLAAAALHYASK